ncbi:transcriptional regulator [Streptomyces sp. CB03234]|uniref:DNA polymerase III subunit beta family protein n=1 Tax=Streptomyces sp. (strain CB03234) TaxID=1703937 RepID=UPI00093F5D93|nr:MerR family transcriptional regulator [Streptomyces sp. CB03234]OKK02310.1 transcriptional regulator [Streptomyces sp. CB03234]
MDEEIDGIAGTGARLSIGAFARRVGLAPSALRFYDDCGVLRPAHVDGVTGYRYYEPGQEARAGVVRRLREAGLPLVDALVVLDGGREAARAVLEDHARRSRDMAAAAQAAVEDILCDLPGASGTRPGTGTRARVGGAEFASAVRQVAPAAAGAGVGEELRELGCVLLELDGQEVRLVATDRFRLAVRVLRAEAGGGGPRQVLVDAAEMRDIAAWALWLPEVTMEIDGPGAWVRSGDRVRAVPVVDGAFPDYRMVLDGLPPARHRIIAGRGELREVLTGRCGSPAVALHTEERRLVATAPGTERTTLRAICTGPALRIAFDPDVLLAALDAGVGPDVLLEISSPTQPVVVRSADQGSFTTLVMPVRETTRSYSAV